MDTNVVLRFLVRDDEAQAAQARKLIATNDILVLASVLMETEWVLRTSYKLSRERIHTLLGEFCGLPSVLIENEIVMKQALLGYSDGMDFADALHLASSGAAEAFATFDADLARKAKDVPGFLPVIAP